MRRTNIFVSGGIFSGAAEEAAKGIEKEEEKVVAAAARGDRLLGRLDAGECGMVIIQRRTAWSLYYGPEETGLAVSISIQNFSNYENEKRCLFSTARTPQA